MTDKITLTNLVNLQNESTAVAAINSNNAVLTAAIDNTLSRDGATPNQMESNIDMNSNRVLNIPTPASNTEPVDFGTFNSTVIGKGNVPALGSTGQVLVKNSGASFDTKWADFSSDITAGTNITVSGSSPAVISTVVSPVFSAVTTPTLINTGSLTLPTSTDTLVGRATTDTLTHKTFDTAGAGNSFSINGAAITTNTGTGTNVLATSPTITTPVISSITNTGTLTLPTSTDTLVGKATTDTLTNKTLDTAGAGNVLKINGTTVSAVTGTGSVVLGTSPTLVTPVLGIPTSGTLTNATGLPVSTGISGLATGVATFLATPSSANLATAVTDETGSGAVVFGTTPTVNQPNIVGVTTNSSAAAGSVGEYVVSTVTTSAVSLSTATAANVTSVSLTAGDWDVWGQVTYNPNTTTSFTSLAQCLGTTSATLIPATLNQYSQNVWSIGQVPGNTNWSAPPVQTRFSLAGTTTVYLVAQATFTVSTMTVGGSLQARRVR